MSTSTYISLSLLEILEINIDLQIFNETSIGQHSYKKN